MAHSNEIIKYEYHVQTSKNDDFEFGYGFIHTNRSLQPFPEFELIVPLFLKKTYDYYEYVDIKKSDTILPIQRQEVNPQFIELGFFEGVNSVSIRYGYQLNQSGIEYIKQRRSEVNGYTGEEVRDWYETVGYFELPWITDGIETTIENIEEVNISVDTIIGRAGVLGITINK
jgi:hypothetical protein